MKEANKINKGQQKQIQKLIKEYEHIWAKEQNYTKGDITRIMYVVKSNFIHWTLQKKS